MLVLRSRTGRSVQVGRWGRLDLRRGYYLYVGSAFGPGGVAGRVARHCRPDKPRHWHIDYLREVADIVSVWFCHSADRLEHRWAGMMAEMPGATPVSGFGCSDCACGSHLFYVSARPKLSQFADLVAVPVEAGTCPKSDTADARLRLRHPA